MNDTHPSGVTIKALKNEIWRTEFERRVPIQPDFQPQQRNEYSETLADIDFALADNDGLRVHFDLFEAKEKENGRKMA